MRIQTRLFLGTALLVLALVGVQWWLHLRQLRAIERELGAVAATVGKDLLSHDVAFIARPDSDGTSEGHAKVWVTAHDDPAVLVPSDEVDLQDTADVRVLTLPDGSPARVERRVQRRPVDVGQKGAVETIEHTLTVDLPQGSECDVNAVVVPGVVPEVGTVELRVVRVGSPSEPFLVISGDAGEHRIPIPVSPTQRIVRDTLQKGLVVSGCLLLVGLAGSGLLATRLTRPLRQLAEGSEAVARGELGVQVEEGAAGEVGELQSAFNRMSRRLHDLEAQREEWRRREHLAQLGDLSRGLAHTVRNPLNTLGLAVEELAGDDEDRRPLVATARHQIRRIDRWLRSFLALGAGDGAASEEADLAALAREVALEAIQEGAKLDLEIVCEPLPVVVVPTAVRSALANLIVNAAEASPASESVMISVSADGAEGVVTIADRGPGLPDEVRENLYSPHVTTKIGGSGMGLFLARQLIVGMHGGSLSVTDREGGGTLAVARIPLAESGGSERTES